MKSRQGQLPPIVNKGMLKPRFQFMASVECLLKSQIDLRALKVVDSNKSHKYYRHITTCSNAPAFTYRLL
jgi:hypothetical protein